MSHVTAMLDAYPKDLGNIDRQKLADCIHACFACGKPVRRVPTPASARIWLPS